MTSAKAATAMSPASQGIFRGDVDAGEGEFDSELEFMMKDALRNRKRIVMTVEQTGASYHVPQSAWRSLVMFAAVLSVSAACGGVVRPNDTTIIPLQSEKVTESSGLAASNRLPGHFWTHNDSGDGPNLYAINAHGVLTGSIVLQGAAAIDWEDIASYREQDVARLIVADVGDNQSTRSSVSLYIFDEPDPHQHVRLQAFQSLQLRYPAGPCDCESIAVDVKRRLIWLVGKSFLPAVSVHSLPLPTAAELNQPAASEPVRLTHRGTLALPLTTGMDIDPSTGDVYLVNYLQCLRFKQRDSDQAGAWITQIPEVTELPRMKQIEAVAVDSAGNVWVTSEGVPGRLARLQLTRPANTENAK